MKDLMAGLAGLSGALLLVPVFRLVALRVGFVDRPDGILKTQLTSVPYLGGVGVWTSWLIVIALLQHEVPPVLAWTLLALLVMGSLDDRIGLSPWVRLLVELFLGGAVGLAVVPKGAWLMSVLGGIPVLVACLGAIALGVAVNAVNMVDGMDGLAGSVAVLSYAGLAVLAMQAGLVREEGMAFAAAGAMLGFLAYNIPPARVYLGDGGAYAAGVLLFYLAFSVAIDWRFCVAALLMVGFFLLEIVTTVLRRLRRGSRLAGGDRSHSYDKMRMHGSSMWTTLTRCSLVQGLFMAGGLAVVTISSDTWAVVAAAGSVLIAVLLLWAFGGLTSVETGGTPGA